MSQGKSVMDALFAKEKMKCTICGVKFQGAKSPCNCWTKCYRCGWSYRSDQTCRNPDCGGDGVLEPMVSNH